MKIKKPVFLKIHFKFSFIFLFFLLLIGSLSTIFLFKFNQKITPKMLLISEHSINKLNETILTNYRVKDLYTKVNLDDTIILRKNSKDEIISVDFNLENVYDALTILTEYVKKSLESEKVRKDTLKYYNEELSFGLNKIILMIPIGVASSNIYFSNLGPKVPVMVRYMDTLSSGIRIKIEAYGINNVLVSIYIDCFITNSFLIPSLEKNINREYNILISSKIIQGIVPIYYGGVMEAKSNILNIPIP